MAALRKRTGVAWDVFVNKLDHNAEVIFSTKMRSWPVLLSFLAILSQMLLPAAHAQSMAKRGGNPILLAFCGSSPEVLEEFRRNASPELLKQLDVRPRNFDDSPCGHVSLTSPTIVPPSVPAIPDWSGWRYVQVASADHISCFGFRTRLPPARAPPELLDFETHAPLLS